MKKTALALLVAVATVSQVRGDCTPWTYGEIGNWDSGESCLLVRKTVWWDVEWPDGQSNTVQTQGDGACGDSYDYCCAPYHYQTRCWPIFDAPWAGDGFWAQNVYAGVFSANVLLNCGNPAAHGAESCRSRDVLTPHTFRQPHRCRECDFIQCNPGYHQDPVTCHCVQNSCPIILDLLGNGFDLTDAQAGVNFDLDSDGAPERLS
jgi:hypothetical protein